ncbi:MAG TPA: hypothetical protein VGR87_00055 [Candidatus Limnocylindria bacterium]|jgi:hypothetical protein|nr:hypothetical protein [Candidatus Limnocylindria bacterium]
MSRLLAAMAAIAVVVSSFAISSNIALGHERRTVGHYQFVVGFLSEPAFAGAINGIELSVTDTRANNKAVEGVEKTLGADVTSGGLQPLAITLATRFGQPGHYAGYFMPTKNGTYIFHFKGKVENTDVDEKFESGPGRFNDVQSTTDLQYPTKVPTGADLAASLADIRSSLDQLRILAIAAVALAVLVPVGFGLAMRRR